MTDENRIRAPRAHGGPQAQPAGGRVRRSEDPLAELARLIGQEDPFADFVAHRPADGRAGGHAGAQRRTPNPRDVRTHDPRGLDRRRTSPSRSPDAYDDLEDSFAPAPEERPRAETRSAYAYGTARPPRTPEIPAAPARSFRDDRAAPQRPVARGGSERQAPVHDDDEFEQPRSPREARNTRRAAMDDDGYGEYAAENYDPEYDDDAYLPAHGDEFYDEAPRRRLKGWVLIGIAAFGAIVVGTSGLFAYRALFGPDVASAPAKLISPNAGPTKMIPGGKDTADAVRGQDRIGGETPRTAERIVPREESPIDQSRIPQGGSADRTPGGTVTAAAPQFSPPPMVAPTAQAPAAQPPASTTAPANLSTEPRRVRTVTVRSDGSVVNAPNQASAPRTAPTPAANPLALQGGQSALPPQRPAGTASSAPLQGDNPWSNIGGNRATATQQAALPQQQAPAPSIAVQGPPPAGSYVVQVAAQKSEGEAQATWQALQQRYSSVLGSQQAAIRRVDLGERGVFYRAQVGPFSTRAQASEVCQSLKAAGGECVIQRN